MDKKLKNNVAMVTGAAKRHRPCDRRAACPRRRQAGVADLDEAELDKATRI